MKFLVPLANRLTANWITLLGTVITAVSGCLIILGIAADLVSPSLNPYASAAVFLILPMLFVFGLLLIPVGMIVFRKARKVPIEQGSFSDLMTQMLSNTKARRTLTFVAVATLINLIIVGAAGTRAISFMDTPVFCGEVCHEVMAPEYTAWKRSPHARVACVECHIGPGATWAVRSKVDGLRQVWGVMTDDFHRPIPAPVQTLRPAQDTCETCHWPTKFSGSRFQVEWHYEEDRDNTLGVTALRLKIGGMPPGSGEFTGSHWHVSPDVKIRYEALDKDRLNIGKVILEEKGKEPVIFNHPEKKEGPVAKERVMDCVDCHNRPTHTYDDSPVAAVEEALIEGALSTDIPFIREMAASALDVSDIPRDRADEVLTKRLREGYAARHPDVQIPEKTLAASGQTLGKLYRRNIFPNMKVAWGTYPNHLGHPEDTSIHKGCFRCHDDEHQSEGGEVISQDCDLCHELLHMGEPLEDLPDLLQPLRPETRPTPKL